MTEWQEVNFGEILAEPVRNGIYKPKEFHGSGTNIVNMGELFKYPRLRDVQMKKVELSDREKEKSLLKNGDLIFARRSLTAEGAGKCSIVLNIQEETTFESSIIRARPDRSIVLPEFLYYFFNGPYGKYLLGTILRQVAVAGITGKDLTELKINIPPLPEQKSIASILSSLDDKIDLLHRQNKTLEAMAETLFRQWFVEGDGDTCTISELIEFNPPRKLAKGSTAPYLEMSALSTTTFHPDAWYLREFSSGTKFTNGDTLLARITPCLENGKAAYVCFLKNDEVAWGSTEYIVMRPHNYLHSFFAYALARNRDFRDYAEGCLEGSSGRQRVNVDHLKNYQVVKPSDETTMLFNSFASSIIPKLHANSRQIKSLEKLRDTLLPKFMSGEVRVS